MPSCPWSHGLRSNKLSVSVAVPPAPVRVPNQKPLAPSVATVTSVANDKGDNEMILVLCADLLAFALQSRKTAFGFQCTYTRFHIIVSELIWVCNTLKVRAIYQCDFLTNVVWVFDQQMSGRKVRGTLIVLLEQIQSDSFLSWWFGANRVVDTDPRVPAWCMCQILGNLF